MISDAKVQEAFARFDRDYANRPNSPWTVAYHAEMWALGQRAFAGSGNTTAFGRLYHELRNRWQVFRSPFYSPPPTPQEVFGLLSGVGRLNPRFLEPAPVRHRRHLRNGEQGPPQRDNTGWVLART